MADGTMMKGCKGDRSLDTVASAMMACDWSPEDTIVVTSLPFGATSTVIADVVETLCERKPLFVVALDEFKAKRVFHCALVKMPACTDIDVLIGRLHGLCMQGRTISAHRFHHNISVQPTPSGPIHFSFKVVENRVLLTEEMVKGALSFCGTIVDAVIRQQSVSKHDGRYCGYGFLSFSALVENTNCVKYVYQRLIDGVVFDCQFSDSFQRSPQFSNDLKQLKVRRAAELHHCAADVYGSDSIPGVYVDDPRRKQNRNEASGQVSVYDESTLTPQTKSGISNRCEPPPPPAPTLQVPMGVFPSYSRPVLVSFPAAPILQPIGLSTNYIHFAPPLAVPYPFHIPYAPVMAPNAHVTNPCYSPNSRLLSKRI